MSKLRWARVEPPRPMLYQGKDGWMVVELPRHLVRERVALIRPDWSEFAPVWKAHWREALADARAGRELKAEHRAPAYTWGDGGAGRQAPQNGSLYEPDDA